MRFVFDTNALISAFLWEGSVSQKLLFALSSGGYELFSSQEILEEFESVLKRHFSYSAENASSLRIQAAIVSSLVIPLERVRVVKEDPADDKILECAVASRSEFVVTYDKHLLKLKEFRGVKIITPEDAFKRLG